VSAGDSASGTHKSTVDLGWLSAKPRIGESSYGGGKRMI
jgi:hypothetical protein